MCLVNVACELAKKKKVLVVDFDLEAPGLTTFEPCRSAFGKSGLVEYVVEYLTTNIAPRAVDYIYKCEPIRFVQAGDGTEVDDVRTLSGELHVMPAGNMQSAYASKYGQIDWGDLYDNRSGFLLLEDLKAQWRALGFDYVLVDSRTGHTDISGICTRQLPDALVSIFVPNEQNLVGLEAVFKEVQADATARSISRQFIFAASRVPQLDDEDGALEAMLNRFKSSFDYSASNFVEIHNYDSLALVNQEVFVCTRPRTRLANEYRNLAALLVSKNLLDGDGASALIDSIIDRRTAQPLGAERSLLEQIANAHKSNARVLCKLAQVYYSRRELELATAAIEGARAALAEPKDRKLEADVLGLQIRIYRASGRLPDALGAAIACLDLSMAPTLVLVDALRTILESDRSLPEPSAVTVIDRVPFSTISETASALMFSRAAAQYGAKMIEYGLSKYGKSASKVLDTDAVLTLIAGGRFAAACNSLRTIASEKLGYGSSLIYLFNYAMADWGLWKKPNLEHFERVRSRFEADKGKGLSTDVGPNISQCMAVAFAILGDKHSALHYVKQAEKSIQRGLGSFSCWSFQPESAEVFERHCKIIEQFIGDPTIVPLFMRENIGVAEQSKLIT
jgi:MinD-like ATPase involved in chromosome partitioning or flagellar assembly